MISRSIIARVVLFVLIAVPVVAKKQPPPLGVIAASAGEEVVIADPDGRWVQRFEVGTVGWLYPAPGGALFAPDLVRGRTTVLDLRRPRVMDQFAGVTMPHFGPQSDRYFVVAGEVMMVSYPDRAIMSRFAAKIDNPWQVIVVSNTVLLVLERPAAGEGGSTLVALDPLSRQVVFRSQLSGDVQRMALSAELALLALADASSPTVRVLAAATLTQVLELPVVAPARDVAFLADGRSLVAATGRPGTGGSVHLWILKTKGDHLRVKREADVALSATPIPARSHPPRVVRRGTARARPWRSPRGEIVRR
jgi:hypothetical protein